jgi:quinohemoprotein ethanol dehydrogenase
MAYDPKLNLLYVGTGNGGPWNRAIRSPSGGDNLFLASILALNPDTGRLVWYYQTTPSEAWDYTATQKLILADLKIDGRMRGVLMQAPKNGFFYVLDRKTGSLISATPYTEITWASRVDLSGRPLETGQGDYSKGAKLLFPGPFGGHQWQPMSYNLKTGLVYIPVQQIPMVYSPAKQPFVYQHARTNMGTEVTGFTAGGWLSQSGSATLPALDDVLKGQPNPRPHLYLQAWDPVKSAIAWQVEITGELDPSVEFLRRAGGVMSTASGLVFQGGPDGYLRVYDARTGKSLHSINVGTSILAAPMTYRIGGEQYVALMAGVGEYDGYVDQLYGKKGRIVAFKLGGGEVPLRPALPRAAPGMEAPSVPRFGTPQQLSVGESLFSRHCAICHAEGRAPNLKRMSAQTHLEFSDIVLKGSRSSEGMGNFGNVLSTDDAQAIHAYIVDSAWQEFERQPSNPESSRREQP